MVREKTKPQVQNTWGEHTSAVFFHPDFNRRPRNLTVICSEEDYPLMLAGLSVEAALPPVGNHTPPQRHY